MPSIPHPTRPEFAARPRLDRAVAEPFGRPFLGGILLQRGLLTRERLDTALDEAERSNRRLGDVLLAHGWLFEDELAHALAEQNGLPYADLVSRSIDPNAAALLPRDFAEHFEVVPIRVLASGDVQLAVADPATVDLQVIEIALGRKVELVVAEISAIKNSWRYCS